MRRGTTPTHKFKVPIDLRTADVVYMTYKQNGMTIVEKNKEEMTISEDEILIELSQSDTLGFFTANEVEIQCRARYPDEAAVASNIIRVPAKKILKEGVI